MFTDFSTNLVNLDYSSSLLESSDKPDVIHFSSENRNRKLFVINHNHLVEEKKVLPNPCFGKLCTNACNSFTEQERKHVFDMFWQLNSLVEQRSFIKRCVNVMPVKRKRTSAHSRRKLTNQYFLVKDNEQKQVCLQFFLSTLNISQKMVRTSIHGKFKEYICTKGKYKTRTNPQLNLDEYNFGGHISKEDMGSNKKEDNQTNTEGEQRFLFINEDVD